MGQDAERKARQLAARQHGVIRRDQALETGLSRRQVDHRVFKGFWHLLFPGVYRVEGAPITWLQHLKAASLWARHDFAISVKAAAALIGFPRFRPGVVELSVTRHLPAVDGVIVHRTAGLHPKELTFIHGICATNATRTLIDLAACVTPQDLRASVDYALRLKLTSLERLDAGLEQAARRPGTGWLRQLVHDYLGGDGPTESELEARVQDVLEAAGYPRAHKQRAVRVGTRLRRLDFLLPGTRVVIEADGYAYHASPRAFEEDRRRHNELATRGYLVLRWTWAALRDEPRRLLAQLDQVLGRGNGDGLFSCV